MTREWKPGDVAIVQCADDYCPQQTHPAVYSSVDKWWVLDDGTYSSQVKPLRPLVVIDPQRLTWDGRTPSAHEFTEWAESMPAGEFATGVLIIADALRDLPPATPPKPPEPTGLGAVVEDAEGKRWVRNEDAHPQCWYAPSESATWDGIDVVKVLSEGVR